MTSLNFLIVHADIIGTLPDTMEMLTSLEHLSIIGDQGADAAPFPFWIRSLTNLKHLEINGMHLTGQISADVAVLTNFTYLSLGNNQLTALPDLSPLRSLSFLYLVGNLLASGTESVWNLPALERFFRHLGSNLFSGGLSSGIANNATKLTHLDLSNNQYNGSLPSSFARLTSLTLLDVSNNYMSGDVQKIIGNLTIADCNVTNNYFVCQSTFASCCSDYQSRPTTITTVSSPSSFTTTSSVTVGQTSIFTISSTSTATTGRTTSTSMPSSSTTNTASNCVGYQCQCSSDLTILAVLGIVCRAGTWRVNGSAVNNGRITIGGSDEVIIIGNYTQTSTGSIELYLNGSASRPAVQTAGSVQLDGTLSIIVSSKPKPSNTTIVISGPTINGTFSNVVVTSQYSGSKCDKITAQPVYSSTQVLVSLSISSTCGKNKKTTGIAVGVTIGLAVIITISVVIIIFVYLKYLKKPDRIIPLQPKGAQRLM